MKKTVNKNQVSKINIKDAETFTHGEEIGNFVSHTVGSGLSIIALFVLTIRASLTRDAGTIVSFMVFGFGLTVLYTMSSIYHGLHPGIAKKIFEILDHSAIYILIAATYTPFLYLVVDSPTNKIILALQWTTCFLGILFIIYYFFCYLFFHFFHDYQLRL